MIEVRDLYACIPSEFIVKREKMENEKLKIELKISTDRFDKNFQVIFLELFFHISLLAQFFNCHLLHRKGGLGYFEVMFACAEESASYCVSS